MRAMDVMTTHVITVGPDASVQDLAMLLSERGISGVPVIDSDNRLIGIVSEGDLLQFPIPVTDSDQDPLTVTVEPLPTGAHLIHQGSLFLFQWVPDMDQAGTYPLEVHVSDGTIETVEPFTVTVVDNPRFQRLVARR